MVKAVIFDAFGTLFNLDNGLLQDIDHPKVNEILDYTRQKQLSYTWLHSLMQTYIPFDKITQIALSDALSKYEAPSSLIDNFASLYFKPVIFNDVKSSLETLQAGSLHIGILSNGTHKMLQAGMIHNEISLFIQHVFSADDVSIFKPSPTVYQLVTNMLNINPNEILFVSSNQWDVAGASAVGFQVAWVNRSHHFRESITRSAGVKVIHSLLDLPSIV